MKRIVAIMMAAVMCFTLSISVSAALAKDVEYSMVLKVLDTEGNVITEAAPGDEVYVGVYVYATDGKADVEIAKNSNASFSWNVCNDPALTAEYAGAEGETEYAGGVENGTGYVTDAGDFMAIFVDSDITAGITLSDSTPVSKVKYVLPEGEAEYTFFIIDAYASVNDGNIDIAPTLDEGVTLTVKEAGPVDPVVTPAEFGEATANGTDGVAIKDTDRKYDNAIAVTATIVPGDASEIGMLFVPAQVNDWTKAAKATYTGALGDGNVTLVAALKNIPRALQGTAFDMLSKAYAVVNGVEQYGDPLTTTINFGLTD